MKKKIIPIMLAILALLIVGCSEGNASSEFSAPGTISEAGDRNGKMGGSAITISLPEDYDTDLLQVRHLSWGRLNYYPEVIRVKAAKKVQIIGDLERLSGCFRSLEIPELGVSGRLTEQQNILEFIPKKSGSYKFQCSMGMGAGTLIVE